MIDIIIPTCKTEEEIRPLLDGIDIYSTGEYDVIIASAPQCSAAENRNAGLDLSEAPYVIMMDDDITNLCPGWNEDLIRELKLQKDVSIVSARLMKDESTPGPTMANNYNLESPFIYIQKTPTACIAFRKTDIRFDENFKGSGFEDDDFCRRMGGKIIIDNRVKVIHKNEMKNQRENWKHNKEYFESKWGVL